MKKFIYSLFIFFGSISLLFAQGKINTDSLFNKLQVIKEDTGKVRLLNNLCLAYTFSDPEKAIEYGEQGILLAEKLNYHKGKAECFYQIGVVHYYQGHYDQSLESYLNGLKVLEKLLKKGNEEENKETRIAIADNLHDIGKVYYRQLQFNKSIDSYRQALSSYKELNHKRGIAGCYNNMAGVFHAQKDFDKTLIYLKEFLKIAEEMGEKNRIATGINNIGIIYKEQGKYSEALNYLTKALKLREELDDTKGLAYSYTDIGELYFEMKNYEKALSYLKKGLKYAIRANAKERIKASYESLAKIYAQLKNFNKAYDYHLLLSQLKDSLFNEASVNRMAEMSAKYENDKKQHQIELLQKDKELQSSQLAKSGMEAKKQQVQKLAFALGFGLVLIVILLVLYSYRQKQRDNQYLALQKRIIEEKHKEITDSINYAKRIQEALLKEEEHISENLPSHFILYKSKDIISGDFYWSLEKQGHLYIAASDCTGHGVPGAMMSMLGIAFLSEIISTEQLLTPAAILDKLREKIVKELSQTGKEGENKDGMDISLGRLNLSNYELQWAGANNPLWIVTTTERQPELVPGPVQKIMKSQNHEYTDEKNNMKKQIQPGNYHLIEVRPDKQPIGYHSAPAPFTNHTLQLAKNSIFYLFTDGFADQFGGPRGKKFKYAQLKELLLANSSKSMAEQKEILNSTFEVWKGNLEQVDDVCIMGIKV